MAKKCKPNWKDLPKEVADLKEQIEQCCEQPSEQTTINGKSGDVVIEAGEGINIDNSGDGIVIFSTGGDLTITDNDQQEVENVKTINFIGATVTDNEDGSVDVKGEPFDIKEWGCNGMFSTPNYYFEIGDYTFYNGDIWVKVAGSSDVFQVPMEFNETKYVLHYDRLITESTWTAEDETVLIIKSGSYEFVIAEGIVSSDNYTPTLKICADNNDSCVATAICATICHTGAPAQLLLGSMKIAPDQIFQEYFDDIEWCGNDPIELPVREYQSHWKRLTTTKINNPLELNNQKLGEVFYHNNNLYKVTGDCVGGVVEERNYLQYDRVVNFTGLFSGFSSDITLDEEIYENEVVLLKESSGMGSLSGYILIKPSENYPAGTYSICTTLIDDILYATSFPIFCPGQTTPIKYDEISGKYYTTTNIDPEYIEYSEGGINLNCAELIVRGAGEDSTTQIVKQVKVTVTPQQLLDLENNPVELIPAQGEGTVINMISASMFLDFNSVAYDFSSQLELSINGITVSLLDINAFNGSVEIISNIPMIAPMHPILGFATGLGFNNPLLLTTNTNATQGDSPVTFVITYTVDNFN